MSDFGALPPEINSGRMYLGPGAAPMLAAASAWSGLANQLSITASGYRSVVDELAGRHWLGPASVAMANAAMPYVAWLHQTALQAAQTATQARAAAAAYELAFAMTVPPPVIAANRSMLLALIATNFFGQNSAAIAATEVHYEQMWVQDATAMYGYNESSSAARQLTPFTDPPPTSNPVPAVQSASPPATALLSIIEHVPNVTNSVLSTSNAVASGRGMFAINARLEFQATGRPSPPAELGARLASISGFGRSGLVGKLSVPSGWLTAAPGSRPTAPALPAPSTGTTATPVAPGSVFSQAVSGTLSRQDSATARHESKPIIVRSPAAG